MLGQCWADVVDGGPTLNQHWSNVSCLLGRQMIIRRDYFLKCRLNVVWMFYMIYIVTTPRAKCSINLFSNTSFLHQNGWYHRRREKTLDFNNRWYGNLSKMHVISSLN